MAVELSVPGESTGMVLIQRSATGTLPAVNAREAVNNMLNAVLGLLDVWEEAIDPASWPQGWEVRYSDRARRPAG